MAHMGNPWLIDCAAVLAKNENVYADMSAFFAENRSITAHDVEVFKQRMEQVRVFLYSYEKFLFGTDYPLYITEGVFRSSEGAGDGPSRT